MTEQTAAGAPGTPSPTDQFLVEAQAKLEAFIASAEDRLAEIVSAAESKIPALVDEFGPFLQRGRELVAQLEPLARTEVSQFASRLERVEGALYSAAAPLVGEIEHDSHGLIQRFVQDVKDFFKPKPPVPSATESSDDTPSQSGSGPAASK